MSDFIPTKLEAKVAKILLQLPALINGSSSVELSDCSFNIGDAEEEKEKEEEDESLPLLASSASLVDSDKCPKSVIHLQSSFNSLLSFDLNKPPHEAEIPRLILKLKANECEEEAIKELYKNKHLLNEETLKAYCNTLKAINARLEKENINLEMNGNKSTEEECTLNTKNNS